LDKFGCMEPPGSDRFSGTLLTRSVAVELGCAHVESLQLREGVRVHKGLRPATETRLRSKYRPIGVGRNTLQGALGRLD
jgi:hypothetical protein